MPIKLYATKFRWMNEWKDGSRKMKGSMDVRMEEREDGRMEGWGE